MYSCYWEFGCVHTVNVHVSNKECQNKQTPQCRRQEVALQHYKYLSVTYWFEDFDILRPTGRLIKSASCLQIEICWIYIANKMFCLHAVIFPRTHSEYNIKHLQLLLYFVECFIIYIVVRKPISMRWGKKEVILMRNFFKRCLMFNDLDTKSVF